MPKHYYSMTQPEQDGPVELYIYGDILCEENEPTPSGSVSSHRLAVALEGLNASAVTVYINSYGGHTSEGLAIYHALRRLECPITTVCDGFACSAASLVFMAGDRRVMQQASLLMIHNAWLPACGNAAQLRKVAEDLDKISAAGRAIYRAAVTISDEELDALLDNESWIAPEEAVAMGFVCHRGGGRCVKEPAQPVLWAAGVPAAAGWGAGAHPCGGVPGAENGS